MLTKDVSQELEEILNSLQQQGKEPSVALVKARLKTPVPMPAIIATIKVGKVPNASPKSRSPRQILPRALSSALNN
ncbi:Uncharacterised protein [Vibrio cholerae]|nr:Uncharacterised protein [Vibrio cholerae]